MNAEKANSIVYLVPVSLYQGALQTIPAYISEAIKDTQVFFVENERTARRFLKSIWKEIVIDNYTWFTMDKVDSNLRQQFVDAIKNHKNISIMSEAGCPGIADPGQQLVAVAHEAGAIVKPLVGPNSIILALMSSGMNGQHFQFHGYLPVDASERAKKLKQLENESAQKSCTQLFIETPYRNNQLLQTMLNNLNAHTQICVAADLTAETEFVRTLTVKEWKKQVPDLHKRPCIFCIYSGK